MFTELAALAKSTTIHLIITSAPNDELKVVVLPQAKEGMNPALCQPLSLTASPEELDEKFVDCLASYKTERKTLEEQLEDSRLVMEAAGKAAQESAADATKKATTKPAAPAPSANKTTAAAPAADKTASESGGSIEEEDDNIFC
jgi:PRTRC genetic system protein E